MSDSKLSIENMMEFAMGLSMAGLFTKVMNDAITSNTMHGLPRGGQKYIYAILDGQQKGPFSLDEVVELMRSGSITPETYIWKQGMADWLPAKEVGDITPVAGATPPPMSVK